MDIEPLAIPAVPDPGLLRLAGARPALPVDVLGEADVGDAGGVLPDHVDVRVQDGGVDGLAVLGQDCRGQGGASQGGRRLTLSPPTPPGDPESPIHFQRPGNLITLVSCYPKVREVGAMVTAAPVLIRYCAGGCSSLVDTIIR